MVVHCKSSKIISLWSTVTAVYSPNDLQRTENFIGLKLSKNAKNKAENDRYMSQSFKFWSLLTYFSGEEMFERVIPVVILGSLNNFLFGKFFSIGTAKNDQFF